VLPVCRSAERAKSRPGRTQQSSSVAVGGLAGATNEGLVGVRLQDKVAIVTGAASGIGRAASLLFAAEGATVVCADIEGEGARTTAARAVEAGGTAVAIPTDVSSSAQVEALVAQVVADYGRIDVLYANAGTISLGTAVDTTEEEWARILGTNLTGVFLCAKHVLPHMVAAGRGAIVNQASIGGLAGIGNLAAYCASKAGVIGLTREMAVDFGPAGIRVNAIAPGTILTPMVQGIFDPTHAMSMPEVAGLLEPTAQVFPLRRIGEADEVAALALFLASDDSSYLTGSIVSVDGGQLASS
jgi:NAD(P)-dependent dehydrogenase (short-subunit alcohol dehydrogenase family)